MTVQDYTLSEPEQFFIQAAGLQEGKKIFKSFGSRKQADSFRVSLYKIRNKLSDFTVLISIDHETVFAEKSCSTVKYGVLDADGNQEGEIILETAKDRLEKAIDLETREILKDAVENSWSPELTQELILAARERITGISTKRGTN